MPIKQIQVQSPLFNHCLSGKQAFFAQKNYKKTTRQELSRFAPLPPSYSVETEHRVIRIIKTLFSIVIFPIAIYQGFHMVAGNILLPSSTIPREYSNLSRKRIDIRGDYKYKRLTIQVDGVNIDAMIVGTPSTFKNRRWLLNSNPNAATYEHCLDKRTRFTQLLSQLNSNALVFNYPGVGASQGTPNKATMEKAYRAMLTFLEKEIRAKEIIAYGTSMGGGAQAAIDEHPLDPRINYVFVKDRTFSSIYSVSSSLVNRFIGFLSVCLGWNINTEASSKRLTAPEIIVQTAHVKKTKRIKQVSQVADDGLITANASLAQALLATGKKWKNKVFIGVKENHFTQIKNNQLIADQINKFLS